ncbi:hypothetical protein T265_09688 [Opisthorchis viverrini]|uniref:Uncharacterized protein n=1 Tax=Opisthorchis viverrini TaxID=6198 RepID=A0A074Z513_OPIVI|nr:hypothetical protein T265_09688 [Opisthorchis viverrini]KER22156.1 hypothetical protein T265_09688 [Opisthorchis viverrini]
MTTALKMMSFQFDQEYALESSSSKTGDRLWVKKKSSVTIADRRHVSGDEILIMNISAQNQKVSRIAVEEEEERGRRTKDRAKLISASRASSTQLGWLLGSTNSSSAKPNWSMNVEPSVSIKLPVGSNANLDLPSDKSSSALKRPGLTVV